MSLIIYQQLNNSPNWGCSDRCSNTGALQTPSDKCELYKNELLLCYECGGCATDNGGCNADNCYV